MSKQNYPFCFFYSKPQGCISDFSRTFSAIMTQKPEAMIKYLKRQSEKPMSTFCENEFCHIVLPF